MHFTLQRKTELALRALRALAANGGTVSGTDLARAIGTTSNYLPQVMSPLVSAGWVTSGRGPNGGYTMQRPASDISMLALIEASEGTIPTNKCVLRGGPCGGEQLCAMHDPWQRAQSTLLHELEQISVLERTQQGSSS